MVSYSQCASSVARISTRPWPGDLRLPSPFRLDLVQYTIALADLAAAGKTRRHDNRPQEEAKLPIGVGRTDDSVNLCAAGQEVSMYLATWGRNLSLYLLLPRYRNPGPRSNGATHELSKGACCMPWMDGAGSQPSPHPATEVACLRSTVIPWHMRQPLHKIWSHQPLPRFSGYMAVSSISFCLPGVGSHGISNIFLSSNPRAYQVPARGYHRS